MSGLTHVELLWLMDRIENRIRFGAIAEQHFLDRTRQVVSFEPGSIFALVRWASNGFGTIVSCRYLARSYRRQALFDGALRSTWRRDLAAPFGLAKGRKGDAGN
jgi:hypothetical protein